MRPITFVLLLSFIGSGTSAKQADHASGAASTCPSATVNYITQTLPQQCLRTDWTRPGSNETTEATAVTSATDDTGFTADESRQADGEPTKVQDEDIIAQEEVVQSANTPSEAAQDKRTPTLTEPEDEDEDGDPLSNQGNFLSFEEWKAQMLEKAGTSPDHIIGAINGATGPGEGGRGHNGINNALDGLGDEGEIELDFSGFVNPETTPRSRPESGSSVQGHVEEAGDSQVPPVKRSKDAGTTSKERFNYASFDCAATVLKINQGSKGATWILSENKDSYLINKCSEQSKHFIVELCNDILIDTIVLGNFEFFSSTFRTFRVSISDRYPVKADKWREIGTFEARNTRGVQAFMVEDGLFWARYLKVELLTHYGSEYYCPISLLRVHGTTMVDDWRSVMKESNEQDDDDIDDPLLIGSVEAEPPEVVPITPIKTTDVQIVHHATSTSTATSTVTILTPDGEGRSELPTASPVYTSIYSQAESVSLVSESSSNEAEEDSTSSNSDRSNARNDVPIITPAIAVTPVQAVQSIINEPPVTPHRENSAGASPASTPESAETLTSSANATMAIATTPLAVVNETSTVTSSSDPPPSTMLTTPPAVVSDEVNITSSASNIIQSLTPTDATPMVSSTHSAEQIQAGSKQEVKPQNATSSSSKSKNKQISPIKASPATPSTQDSFFRAVHKRLQMLEANSTLSLQYIEEQSRILRDAFAKAEKKQLQKTSNFLETLNSTVLSELRNFRIQYDQIWQSTVLELSSQREQSQSEVKVLGERLGMLANELVWQKRVVYLQFVLIVLCLGLVMFSKNGVAIGASAPLDLTLLQSIQHLRRHGPSMSFSNRYPGSLDSPPGTPSRPTSFGGMFGVKSNHQRTLSDGVTSGDDLGTNPTSSPEQHRHPRLHVRIGGDLTTMASDGRSKSPSVSFGPITPASEQGEILDTKTDTEGELELPEVDLAALKRAASSPPLGRQFDPPTDDEMSSGAGDSDVNGSRGIVESIQAA